MKHSIYSKSKPPRVGEKFIPLLKRKNVLIERIVSSAKPEDKIYIQKQDEWVMVMKGCAQLETKGKTVILKTGDYIFIKKGQKHMVKSTNKGTVWLTVHIH